MHPEAGRRSPLLTARDAAAEPQGAAGPAPAAVREGQRAGAAEAELPSAQGQEAAAEVRAAPQEPLPQAQQVLAEAAEVRAAAQEPLPQAQQVLAEAAEVQSAPQAEVAAQQEQSGQAEK